MSNAIKIKGNEMYITTDIFNDYINSITEYSTHFYILFGFGNDDAVTYKDLAVYKYDMTETEIQEFREYYTSNDIYYINKREE